MKFPRLLLPLLLAGRLAAHGGTVDWVPPAPEKAPSTLKMGSEIEAEYSYVGGAQTDLGQGRDRTGRVREQYGGLRILATPQWGQGPVWRAGLSVQRFSFGLPSNAPVPNTLQSAGLILGLDFQLSDSWLMRAEVEPGFYGDNDLDLGDFNAPFIVGASWIVSASLQWVAGVSVDANRRYPFIPAVGVRWNFTGPWTLNLVLPTPRLEYEWSKDLTLFTGAEIKDGTFRVGSDFGEKHKDRGLNDAYVEYEEIRVGAGFSWKPTKRVSLEAEGGYLPYREFNFHRAEVGIKTKEGAPYAQVGLSAKF